MEEEPEVMTSVQREVLERMANGEKLQRCDQGRFAGGTRYFFSAKNINGNTVYALHKRGWIKYEDKHGAGEYCITGAGRKALRQSSDLRQGGAPSA